MKADLSRRAQRRWAKLLRTVESWWVMPRLSLRSANSKAPLTDPGQRFVVTLTSYGPRLKTAHLAVESIGAGRVRPARLILFTDPGGSVDALPHALRRQMARGLEIIPALKHLGPHTKYYPYVAAQKHHERALITADDDTIYPVNWAARLEDEAARHPEEILCYRAHKILVGSDGRLLPYNSWDLARGGHASRLNFATGVSGVRYPARFLEELNAEGDRFMEICPRADDVWLHYRAIAGGWRIRQITDRPVKFPEVSNTQDVALHRSNTGLAANDEQIAATYDASTVQMIVQEASSE